jgi:hypothetical protein
MPWTPTEPILSSRAIAESLATYFAANQVDAILWAHGSALKPVSKFSNSVANRTIPVFPAMAFSDDNDVVEYGNDLLDAAYSVTFEFMVQNADADTAVTQARSYLKAFISMMVNCPQATLATNTGAIAGTIVIQTVESGFDPIKTNEQQNDFLQMFQIRAVYTISASAN